MGGIRRSLERQNELTVFSVLGQVTAAQVFRQIEDFLTEDPTRLALWDFTEGTLAAIPSKDLRAIINRGKKLAHSRNGGKTALVQPGNIDYGLGRMIEAHAEIVQLPLEIRAFRDVESARAWLELNSRVRGSG
ncbi:hypothetical protein ACFL0Q_08465 [Thermodesulfobacteriota bacterium]